MKAQSELPILERMHKCIVWKMIDHAMAKLVPARAFQPSRQAERLRGQDCAGRMIIDIDNERSGDQA